MRGEQAIFNLEIKKKSGLSINPDIHHSKVSSSGQFSLQIRPSVQGYRCESCIVNFVWSVTWNNDYSPFKNY